MSRTIPSAAAACLFAGCMLILGCSKPIDPDPVQIAGTWTGAASDSSGPGTMTWTLTQSGSKVSGSAVVATPLKSVVLTGTFSGTLAGAAVTWRIDVPPGGVSGQAGCTVSVTGAATVVDAGTIDGTYAGSGSCTSAFTGGLVTLKKQ